MVIVDTSVWIQFLRVRGSPEHLEVDRLLGEREVAMVGVVLAEVLQGARNQKEFDSLHDLLSAVPYIEEERDTWQTVGTLSYQLRRRGLTPGLVDLYIVVLASIHDAQIYTLDGHFGSIPGAILHRPGSASW